MLDCFDGILWDRATCAPTSGQVSLQAVGLDRTLIGKLVGPEDSIESMVEACEEHARAVMVNDVITHFAKSVVPFTFLDRRAIGTPCDPKALKTDTGIGGVVIEVNQPRSNVVLTIANLGIFADVTGPVVVKVYDLDDGAEVATQTVEAIAGAVSVTGVQIELKASRRRRAFFVTTDQLSFYCTDVTPGSTACGSCGDGYTNGGVTLKGGRLPDGVPPLRANVRTVSHTSGVMVTVTAACDHAALLCESKNVLALPYAYKVAEAIMARGASSMSRINDQTIDRDQLRDRADRYGAQYAAAMSNVVANMRPPEDSMCFVCATPTRNVIAIP